MRGPDTLGRGPRASSAGITLAGPSEARPGACSLTIGRQFSPMEAGSLPRRPGPHGPLQPQTSKTAY